MREAGARTTPREVPMRARTKGRDGTVRAMPVEKTDMASLAALLVKHVDLDATVYTDEYGGYNSIPHQRETVRHGAGEYVKEQAHTNGIYSRQWARG